MGGLAYVWVPLLLFAFATGAVGKYKGSSFVLWFVIGFFIPAIGLFAAFAYRNEKHDPLRECPNCGNVVGIAVQVCGRCGEDLEYPDEFVAPKGYSFTEEPEDEQRAN
jgi:hypothetical protein